MALAGFPLDPFTIEALNSRVRGYFFAMSAGEIRLLAEQMQVSYREVERWFTLAGQRRRMVNLSYAGLIPLEAPDPPGMRILAAMALADGIDRPPPWSGPDAPYKEETASLADAVQYAVTLVRGGIDPYLDRAWYHIDIRWNGPEQGWMVNVITKRREKGDGGT
jgi:hypothetical protein